VGYPSYVLFVDFKEWASPPYAFFVDFKVWATLAFFVDFKECATPPYAFFVDFKEWATPPYVQGGQSMMWFFDTCCRGSRC
jgi:hypothetical protein